VVQRNGASSDAIELSHLIQEEAVLQATDEDLNQACKCFSTAFEETMNECKISHIMCKAPQTCIPIQSCPLVQPNDCAPKSGNLNPQTPVTYSCDVDYCTEGTGTCAHSWWATANNLPPVPAACDDSSSEPIQKNQETFGLKARCQVLRPNKRSTTYTVVVTTISTSPAGLSAAGIAGIVIGVLAALLIVGAFIFFVFYKAPVDHQ
jgi:hypothetical protein